MSSQRLKLRFAWSVVLTTSAVCVGGSPTTSPTGSPTTSSPSTGTTGGLASDGLGALIPTVLPTVMSPLLALESLPAWPHTTTLPGADGWNDAPPVSAAYTAAALPNALTFVVDCQASKGSTNTTASGGSFSSIDAALGAVAIARTQPATKDLPMIVRVRDGVCEILAPLQITSAHTGTSPTAPTVLVGDSASSVISGGGAIPDWQPVDWPGAPTGRVVAASISAWPVQVKSLRVGSRVVPPARWPRKVGDGSTTPNWLFASSWSNPGAPSDNRHPVQLGLDPAAFPLGTNFSSLVNAYAHVFGCIEKDVNSQLTRIAAVSLLPGTTVRPSATLMFRNSFTVNQRFYLENVRWALSPGSFYVSDDEQMVYMWLPDGETALAPVIAPVTDLALNIDGAQHLTISNLTFVDLTFYADGYWDGPAQQPSDAAIRINRGRDVQVESSNFLASLGGYGVAIGNGSVDCRVLGSLFDHMGQGGVIAYGFDAGSNTSCPAGCGPGTNVQPERVTVAFCAMADIGQRLIHVAGVGFRSASNSRVAHTRLARSPRYGFQADSFYAVQNSRGNIFEFNQLSETSQLTTDTGAIEMLGSGNPNLIQWLTNATIRFNNISDTIGSSSSDGKTVCIRGQGTSCRGLVWAIYLDGGEAGIDIYGNILGASGHGAVFDNAGGNNSQWNNVFVGEARSQVLMDFGAPGVSNLLPSGGPTPASIAGNTVLRNIFLLRSASTLAMSSMTPWSPSFLKSANSSDYNLYWDPTAGVDGTAAATIFPGGKNLSQWQHGGGNGVPVCGGQGVTMTISPLVQAAKWHHNATDARLYTSDRHAVFVLNIDCEGNWANCAQGTAETNICLAPLSPWIPQPEPPAVHNQGWRLTLGGQLQAEASKHCLEVCNASGAVAGCNGGTGSTVHLSVCSATNSLQQWALRGDPGTIESKGAPGLFLAPPSITAYDADVHSVAADPLFVDSEGGNFRLQDKSPAFALGFQRIPPIRTPSAVCGGDTMIECLSLVMPK